MTNFTIKLRRFLLKLLYPITQRLGKVHAPWSHRAIKSYHYREIRKLIRPGDVFLLQKSGELSNLFIPGFWGHASIYCDKDRVVEAVGIGVVNTDLIDALLSRDAVMVRRPKFATPAEQKKAADWALQQIGAEYDLFFDPGNKAFYCSELIWMAYEKTMGVTPFTLRQTLGLNTVTPEDIANANDKWETIYDSRN